MASSFQKTIITKGKFPFYHCSCLCELPGGSLMATWHAGANEKQKSLSIFGVDYDVSKKAWSEPRMLANTEDRTDCDPGLFFDKEKEELWLFYQTMHHGKIFGDKYKTGYSLCTIKYQKSSDLGKTWEAWNFLRNMWGWVIRSKAIELQNGDWLLPLHREFIQYQAMFYKSKNRGKSWSRVGRLNAPAGALEPSVAQLPDGRLVACMRTKNGYTYMSESVDNGDHWSKPVSTGLYNPSSAVDLAVTKEGYLLLAFNDSQKTRAPLTIAGSIDGGKTWIKKTDIVPEKEGQFSYPSMLQGQNGDLHVVFSWQRTDIAHVLIPKKEISSLVTE
ncbi:MAG: exo-alpha-sialidase [Candidatus Hodarchaeota archaeon]